MRRINNTIGSEKFIDGVCYIYKVNELNEIDEGSGIRLNFSSRNLSYKRIMEAAQVQCSYSKIIGVPLIHPECFGGYRCVSIEEVKYRIETIQEIYSAMPPTAVLGLNRWGCDTAI